MLPGHKDTHEEKGVNPGPKSFTDGQILIAPGFCTRLTDFTCYVWKPIPDLAYDDLEPWDIGGDVWPTVSPPGGTSVYEEDLDWGDEDGFDFGGKIQYTVLSKKTLLHARGLPEGKFGYQ